MLAGEKTVGDFTGYVAALLLARQFFDLQPSRRLRYATLGLLFVNVSIGGTLTHFAAPPVLMVSAAWQWDSLFMLHTFGWRAVLAITSSTLFYVVMFRREFAVLATRPAVADPAKNSPPPLLRLKIGDADAASATTPAPLPLANESLPGLARA